MTIDGFHERFAQAFIGYETAKADSFWKTIASLADRMHVEMSGFDKLPEGRALLVMNHAFGWDAVLPVALIKRATKRRVWVLGEHMWWKVPFVRQLAVETGAVDGTQDNVDALLEEDELVLVLPGGLREAMKPRELRYRLMWGDRYGFARAALRNGAPIVPLAGIGADEMFEVIGDAYARGRKWLHRDFPLPRLGFGSPFFHRPQLHYAIGNPIVSRCFSEEDPDVAAHRLCLEARGALEQLIDQGLAARVGLSA
jgi:1-acyl-sn-glycerol-3-phosphate acyltransferase